MAQHDGTAAHGAMGAYGSAARNAGAAGHGGVFAHPHVVADLDQVVELDAVFEHSILQRAAVYAGIGPDLDVVTDQHTAQLLDLDPLPVMQGKAKTVGAYHRARMHDAARAYAATVRHSDARRQAAIRPDLRMPPDNTVFRNACARAYDGALAYAGKGAHRDAGRQCGRGVDKGAGMNPRRGLREMPLPPELGHQCKGVVRIIHHDASTPLNGSMPGGGRHDDASRSGLREFGQVFRVAEEAEVFGAGGLQCGEPLYLQARIAGQFDIDTGGKELDDVGKTKCHTAPAVRTMVIVVKNTPAINGRRSAP
jgi:hypothetical protein